MAIKNGVKISLADSLVEDLDGYQEQGLVVFAYVIDEWLQIDNILDDGDHYVILEVFDDDIRMTMVSAEQIKGVRYTRVAGES
jgi:hypothetical protein